MKNEAKKTVAVKLPLRAYAQLARLAAKESNTGARMSVGGVVRDIVCKALGVSTKRRNPRRGDDLTTKDTTRESPSKG